MGDNGLLIDPREVEATVMDCLYREDELPGGGQVPEGAVIVAGITRTFGFHPERLEGHRLQVGGWLRALPSTFRVNEGGGWSFLAACNQENGVQWTSFHVRMEELFCLGIGLGLVTCLLPRESWGLLPGGMPYYAITVTD